MTRKGYTLGTHRACAPAETLARIQPLLAPLGVTRCADVTGLDHIGIPVACAIRPRARTIQVSNGKGLRPVDARVSALMEAIELAHAELDAPDAVRRSLRAQRVLGPTVSPAELPGFFGRAELLEDLVLAWAPGHRLAARTTPEPFWLPASMAWMCAPSFTSFSTNGLASGNTVAEATLHALYEVLERHAMSTLVDGDGQLDFGAMHTLALADAPGAALAELRARADAAGVRLVLLRAPGDGAVHVFMAVLLDARAAAAASTVNMGHGAHLSAEVAAVRAITEAAQTRLTFIHGSREDLSVRAYDPAGKSALLDFFAQFEADTSWDDLPDGSGASLEEDLDATLDAVAVAGLGPVYRIVLSAPDYPVAVVKVSVGGARMDFLRM